MILKVFIRKLVTIICNLTFFLIGGIYFLVDESHEQSGLLWSLHGMV
jgi:hypothetical protein